MSHLSSSLAISRQQAAGSRQQAAGCRQFAIIKTRMSAHIGAIARCPVFDQHQYLQVKIIGHQPG
jgi:hypothetical protein